MLNLSAEQEHRYLTDADFHARVEVVSRALWDAVSRFDLGHCRPFPYSRLAAATKCDLTCYAVAAVEALEGLEASRDERQTRGDEMERRLLDWEGDRP